jgi:transcriptional regulator with GAF, ATPase, and Fis domain
MMYSQIMGSRGGRDPKRLAYLADISAAKAREYAALAEAGLSQQEAARALGVARVTVTRAAKRYGLTFRRVRLA